MDRRNSHQVLNPALLRSVRLGLNDRLAAEISDKERLAACRKMRLGLHQIRALALV